MKLNSRFLVLITCMCTCAAWGVAEPQGEPEERLAQELTPVSQEGSLIYDGPGAVLLDRHRRLVFTAGETERGDWIGFDLALDGKDAERAESLPEIAFIDATYYMDGWVEVGYDIDKRLLYVSASDDRSGEVVERHYARASCDDLTQESESLEYLREFFEYLNSAPDNGRSLEDIEECPGGSCACQGKCDACCNASDRPICDCGGPGRCSCKPRVKGNVLMNDLSLRLQ